MKYKSKHTRPDPGQTRVWSSRVWSYLAKFLLWIMLLSMIAGVVYFGFLRPSQPVKTVTVTIKKGLNTAQIGEKLAQAGIISNTYSFRVYATLTQTEAKLQPGKYTFKTDLSYYDILKEMTKKQREPRVKIIIPEGFTGTQIAKRLAEKTDRPDQDFYEFIRGQGVANIKPAELPPEIGTLEGYLFPKTYLFGENEHPSKIISRMVRQYELEVSEIDWSYAGQKDFTRHQIMTIASLIEEEAKVPDERAVMAAVIYNRLDAGMPLQLCSTVQYVLPRRKEVLSEQDLKIASPYNTYQQTGLPPGPIANPGIDSIRAALAPAQVDYLYFVLTSKDGRHTFTNNYNEFLVAKKRADQSLNPSLN